MSIKYKIPGNNFKPEKTGQLLRGVHKKDREDPEFELVRREDDRTQPKRHSEFEEEKDGSRQVSSNNHGYVGKR